MFWLFWQVMGLLVAGAIIAAAVGIATAMLEVMARLCCAVAGGLSGLMQRSMQRAFPPE